jgi:hypothetical protein
LDAVAQSIAEGNVRVAGLQGEMDRLHQATAALGAVNLAALDELAAASERKTFLDMQMADLTEAMNTLEDAIRKIDAETRELLSGTFDAVNHHRAKKTKLFTCCPAAKKRLPLLRWCLLFFSSIQRLFVCLTRSMPRWTMPIPSAMPNLSPA